MFVDGEIVIEIDHILVIYVVLVKVIYGLTDLREIRLEVCWCLPDHFLSFVYMFMRHRLCTIVRLLIWLINSFFVSHKLNYNLSKQLFYFVLYIVSFKTRVYLISCFFCICILLVVWVKMTLSSSCVCVCEMFGIFLQTLLVTLTLSSVVSTFYYFHEEVRISCCMVI